MIKIEKNIPLPGVKSGRQNKYPFSEMEIGDSFFYIGGKAPHAVGNAAIEWSKRNGGNRKFPTRQVTENGIDGVRIWRVK